MPNTIPANGEAMPKPDIRDLETHIMDAMRMSSILERLLMDLIGVSPEGVTGNPNLHNITEEEVEDVLFASIQVSKLIDRLRAEWHAISYGSADIGREGA